MRSNEFVQADIRIKGTTRRFWMDSCGGRDQVANWMARQGWQAYEQPLPAILSTWCAALNPVFVDVGANTGFFSLLALASGAREAHAFEPVDEIAEVLRANAAISEMTGRLTLCRSAVGQARDSKTLYFPLADHGLAETSASLNAGFRAEHSETREITVTTLDARFADADLAGAPVILKIDVETMEPEVLKGAAGFLARHRPAILVEILPGADADFFTKFAARHSYEHVDLYADLRRTDEIEPSLERPDHLFLPSGQSGQLLGILRQAGIGAG